VKLKFRSDLDFQREAIDAVVDLFEGQPPARDELELAAGFGGLMTELGCGNRLDLGTDALTENLRRVQERNGIGNGCADGGLLTTPSILGGADPRGGIPHFSAEMETGTGKTYVYLRTIYELNRRYGFAKFVIVVPGVAIREGVMKNIELTREHFEALYGKVPVDAWVYDSKQISKLRQFASSNHVQVLVINIDAFNKDTNVLNLEQDRLSGRKPIEFIQATFPVVIVDEPQNMESERARAAIASLNPLCTLRYSATHRNVYNLVYRLGPVAAYDKNLVKHIEVDSVLDDEDFNRPYVEVVSVEVSASGPVARLRIDVQGREGPRRKKVTIRRPGADLFELSRGREQYRGYRVTEINAAHGYVEFGNGIRLDAGESSGAPRDDIMRVQIRRAVKEHLDKELAVRELPEDRRMKVLSLFFIDRVANYAPEDGKIRRWFVETYEELAAGSKYTALELPPVDQVHNGYFASDRHGRAKDTRGRSKADDAAYQLIMRDKERLLSPEEPLRFIFSHSALREGWDNPNVFQICTLNETRSEMKKRQEIGRGLRLPVMANGERCHDQRLNRLTVVANESYEEFARRLQSEIQEECGESFEGRVRNKRERRTVNRRPLSEDFKALWRKIKHRTRYAVEYSTADLISRAAEAIRRLPAVEAPKIATMTASLELGSSGVTTTLLAASEAGRTWSAPPVPDLLAYLQRETNLTRATLAAILGESGRLGEAFVNPQKFLDGAAKAVRGVLSELMVAGIKYELLRGPDAAYAVEQFEPSFESYEQRLVDVAKSVYEAIEYDSDIERKFARGLDDRTDIRLFVKLPAWFKVPTPVGSYNPDWAIVLDRDETVYLVRETKGTTDLSQLRPEEAAKIRCGTVHFKHLGVDFAVVKSPDEVR